MKGRHASACQIDHTAGFLFDSVRYGAVGGNIGNVGATTRTAKIVLNVKVGRITIINSTTGHTASATAVKRADNL